MQTRRTFLSHLSAAGILCGLPRATTAQDPTRKAPALSVFTKPLQSLSFDELGKTVASLGFAGIELPVRKRGHIEPAQAAEKIPEAVEAFARHGVKLTILTSDITSLEGEHAEDVLLTAKKHGVTHYRAGWYRYKRRGSVKETIRECTPRAAELAAFNKQHGLQGLLQNHSGARFVGSAIWDFAMLLEDVDPNALGVAFDLGHATIEGGKTWPNHVDVIWPHVRAVYAKDFVWRGKKTAWVPFGTGNIDKKFYRSLRDRGFDGPISLHIEYDKKAKRPVMLEAMKRDRARLAKAIG